MSDRIEADRAKIPCKCPHEHPHREAPGLCLYCYSDAMKENKRLLARIEELERGLSLKQHELEVQVKTVTELGAAVDMCGRWRP